MKHITPLFNSNDTNSLCAHHGFCFVAAGMAIGLFLFLPTTVSAQDPSRLQSGKYEFDGSISREVLGNYLDRSITMGYFLVPGTPEGYEFPYRQDDIRMIKNIGAKFIGRAIYRWGGESKLNDPAFLAYAKDLIENIHAFDSEVVFSGMSF